MDKLVEMVDTFNETHTHHRLSAHKAHLETKAGTEMRDAFMSGMVRREELTDVTAHESATAREKMAQRCVNTAYPL